MTIQQSVCDLLIQITLWSSLGIALLALINRYLPQRLAQFSWCFVLGVMALSVLIWIPWPAWVSSGLTRYTAETPQLELSETASPQQAIAMGFSITLAWDVWHKLLPVLPSGIQKNRTTSSSVTSTSAIFSVLFAGMLVSGLQLLRSYLFVRSHLASSQPVTDETLQNICNELYDQLHITRKIRLLIAPTLRAPATIGYLHPVILLPADWHTWSKAECRTVLAHELAHIQRSDYLTVVITQIVTIFYWFHPLVRCLCHYMRAGQELAADALAVRIHGDQAAYLHSLARLALVQDGMRLPAPARLFLSPEVSLLRRIVMLREGSRKVLASRSGMRCLLFAAMIISGAAVAALRSPVVAEDVTATKPCSNADWQRYIPRHAVGCMVMKPAAALKLESMKEWTSHLNQLIQQQVNLIPNAKGMGIALEAVECFAGALEIKLTTEGTPRSLSAGARIQYLRLRNAADAEAWIQACVPQCEKVESKDGAYYRVTSQPKDDKPASCLLRPDNRTIIFAESEQQALAWLANDQSDSNLPAWVAACPAETGVLTVSFDTRHELLKKIVQQGKEVAKSKPAFQPLFDFEGCITCTVPFNDHLNLMVALHCVDTAKATKTCKQLDAIFNMLKLVQVAGNVDRNSEKNATNQQLFTELLNNTRTSQKDSTVNINTECSMKLGEFLKNEVFKGASIKSENK